MARGRQQRHGPDVREPDRPHDLPEYQGQPDVDGGFQAEAGETYTVQYRDSLTAGSWLKLMDFPAPAESGLVEFQDTTANVLTRFYRIITPA